MRKPGQIMTTIEMAHAYMVQMGGVKQPRIAVAGLNPHCEPIFGDQVILHATASQHHNNNI
jgi:4-hydroxy-L-threonine phosphate dehydrogenase PdxA